MQLPSDRTMRRLVHRQASGIDEDALLEYSKKYDQHKATQASAGHSPVGEGVLIWDEVKV